MRYRTLPHLLLLRGDIFLSFLLDLCCPTFTSSKIVHCAKSFVTVFPLKNDFISHVSRPVKKDSFLFLRPKYFNCHLPFYEKKSSIEETKLFVQKYKVKIFCCVPGVSPLSLPPLQLGKDATTVKMEFQKLRDCS